MAAIDNYDARMLAERAKELECMYAVDEILQNKSLTLSATMTELVNTIPLGFTASEACRVRIQLWDGIFLASDYCKATSLCNVPIVSEDGEPIGEITAGYIQPLLEAEAPLLDNEVKLLRAIARRISIRASGNRRELSLLLDMLRRIDPDMLRRIGEKLRVHLKNTVGARADALFSEIGIPENQTYGEVNSPTARPPVLDAHVISSRLIQGATAFLPQDAVYTLLSGWIQEERVLALVRTVDSKDASISDILEAVRKYTDAVPDGQSTGAPIETWLVAELAHRFLTSDETVINLILDHLRISDFIPMLERIIGSETSMGNIGGKGAGLFIAGQIVKHAAEEEPLLRDIRLPRTWYLAADQIVDLLHYNSMEDLNSYKYNSTFYLRMTYGNIVSKIKNARLPPHTVRMLRIVLEDLEDTPLIVRSSSLLEDRHSGAFSGKYKSLFLANQGTKQERLEALVDAVLEVYSSMYNPDAIQYRRERGLLNFTEQMGVLIQEVVGRKIGKYFMPAYGGVAFSHNLLRWSSRISREDGLVRMVMGLGTRAVDRVNDDYPILFSPGKPGLQVNQSPDDIRHYSPKRIDLINLETAAFETVDIAPFLREQGKYIPDLHRYVSVYNRDFVESRNAFSLNPQTDDMVVTFAPILAATDLPARLKRILEVLSDRFDSPVDIEFACDGQDLYLLQCRPQGSGYFSGPAPIPKNLSRQDTVFTAGRYISDGMLRGITHVVYVDGGAYDALSTREELLAVGTAVGMLNDVLPRRKYILMGPGRWGSRGDIKLGVRVTYSDISGTAALIEVAREKQSYVPELSFGTHFFQDLVESGIVYIPLYPDEKGIVFRESFFRGDNLLGDILPQYAWLSDVVRVIDVPAANYGKTLSIHMNSELEQAVAFLQAPGSPDAEARETHSLDQLDWTLRDEREHWQWRHYMAQQIADTLDMEGLGVRGVYLFGSTNTGSTGMGSDIDLLLHFDGTAAQRVLLEQWLDGWSRALAKINFLHTGYNADRLLDLHIVTDADIASGDSFAIKIHSTLEPAAPLRLRG
ncbi:nucleotidyltransferase domain-containing protein [Ruminococcaceae bacterium OttesenSCG-928-L11]|nr:nucleotidyltransferase domain-containing protein [Ruminococcaceae bacterium OttesenSCG-928-L11]